MERAELITSVDELLKEIANIRYDDYHAGIAAVRKFELIAHQASHLIAQFTTEHIHQIENDFDAMRRYKRDSIKREHFNSAIRGLKDDVASMKRGQ